MKTLYLECSMGAAGDMLMSALYELLDEAQQAEFLSAMSCLTASGVRLIPEKGATCGITGTHMRVYVHGHEEDSAPHGHDHDPHHGHDHDHHHDHHDHCGHDHPHDHPHDHAHDHDHHDHHHEHATPAHITRLIEALPIPAAVKTHACAVYGAIAQAEAAVHGCPVGEVHYHEVGSLDAVADVTGVCLAIHMLAPVRIVVSPIHVGSGTVRCAHGLLPVPAPATTRLLTGAPIYGGEIQGELCTPTGAALLTHFADSFGPMPAMCTEKIGCGLGTRPFPQANCLRAFLGQSAEQANGEITELVCNLDDMTGEALAFACAQLLEAGALDVYTIPGQLKKGRPGQILTVLCSPDQEQALAAKVLSLTTTNGVRSRRCGKYFLTPGTKEIDGAWGALRLKTASGFGVTHVKPEYEDAAAIARANGVSYQTVAEDAMSRYG